MEIADVQHFWRIHVRFRAAKYLIEIGLWAMPECKYKIDLVGAMQRVHGKLLGIRENEGVHALVQRVRLAHDAGAGFHLSEEEMTALLDAASRS
jgi:hypothetical protein